MFKILWANLPAKFFLSLSASVIIIFSSCNKASVIGLDVQPPNDLIDAEYQDTLTLLTQTVVEDSLRTDGNLLYTGLAFIGKYYDPVFGQATSSLYAQLIMNANAPTFGDKPTCDSVRLILRYNGDMYGKKAKPRQDQVLNVYQLTDDLNIISPYYSNQTKSYGLEITKTNGYVFKPRPADSVMISGVKSAPSILVPIQESFGQAILDKQNSTELASIDNFLQFIKGLYITTEKTTGIPSKEGNIFSFNLSYCSLKIYYRNSTDTLQYTLPLSGARFMHFDHAYSPYADPDIQKQLSPNPPAQNDVVYIQSMSGLKTKVTIPNLLTWGHKESIAINRAELIIKPISTRKDTFALIPTLNLYGISDDGKKAYALDDALEGTNYFGGSYDTLNNTYHFTITRQIQQLLTGKRPNNGFFITSASGSTSPNRLVLGGGSATLNGGIIPNDYQMKLKVTYTKLK